MTLSALLNVFPESKWSADFFFWFSLFFLVLYFVIKWCFYSFCCNSGNRFNITTQCFSFLLGVSDGSRKRWTEGVWKPETGLTGEPRAFWRFGVQSWHEAAGLSQRFFVINCRTSGWRRPECLRSVDCGCFWLLVWWRWASQKQQNQMLTSTLP